MAQTGTALATAASTAELAEVIAAIRGIISEGRDPERTAREVAAALEPALACDRLLSPAQREPDPANYRQHILHVEPDGSFSIVALVWLPGQATPVHDHVCWCVVGVHQGEEFETRYVVREADGDRWLEEAGTSTNPRGSVAALVPPGDVHKVENAGNGLAISLHVYGADIGALGSSVRRRYDIDIRGGDAG